MSFTWYGSLRTTCRRLRRALSREIWTARRAAGMEESTFVVIVVCGGNPGFGSAYFVPRVGGGWVQLPSPAREEEIVSPFVLESRCGSLHLRKSQDPDEPPWVTSVDIPADNAVFAFMHWDDRHCHIGIHGNEVDYDDGECPSDEKTRHYVLYRGEQSWTRLNDPPHTWGLYHDVIHLPGGLVCQFQMEGEYFPPQFWVYTFVGDRWDRIEDPARCASIVDLAAYDQDFVIYPRRVDTPLDMPFYHCTVDTVDNGKPRVTYTNLSTPALAVARAWAQAAGFDILLKDGVGPYLQTGPPSWRQLDISVTSPVRF